ncbi:hypothetical protein [Loktanella sp. M215]|uniref:hypothetical protein n=1 Tax=Loktanella sp. M215 TaxID=2675431 RepID=UPI001F3C4447|nr:hypothetical protein [Loktanella sp. M215]MBU2359759.1 hypothetical protein [Alphaproteobacteria bacterium]MCF7700867.1 hypothetical protein [Loktanella sp. M215]
MKLFVVFSVLMIFGAVNASAAPCSAVGHTIAAENAGFVPNKMYFCVDTTQPATNDKIYIQNNSGRTLTIRYKALNGADIYTSTINNGAKSPALATPGGGAFTALIYTNEQYCTKTDWKGRCTAYGNRTVESSYYSSSNDGSLVIGNAPNSY